MPNRDNKTNKDLTRIEDLSEFLHQEDPELDSRFENESDNDLNEKSSLMEINELDDTEETPPPFEISSENESENEINFEQENSEEVTFQTDNIEEESSDSNFSEDSLLDFSEETPPSMPSEIITETNLEIENIDEFYSETIDQNEEIESDSTFEETLNENVAAEKVLNTYRPESLSEVKTFSENFNYGSVTPGGNPPFSIVIDEIKFKEDADDILSMLKEFSLVNDTNINDTEIALNMGTILIPHISEYLGIIISHKLKNKDLIFTFGLSDQVITKKSDSENSKGLISKKSINQNKNESKKLNQKQKSNDFFQTVSSSIPQYRVVKYLGVGHAHIVLDIEEFDRLSKVHKALNGQTLDETENEIYQNYLEGHHALHDELVEKLKNETINEGGNALLSIQFSLTNIPSANVQMLRLSCTCNKAIVENDN